jgi:putative transcription factor
MACDMCGKNPGTINTEIEGVTMQVCADCSHFGKRIIRPRIIVKDKRQRPKSPEIVERIVDNYAQLIKQAREKRNVKQDQFAKMLNEKESLMQRVESGKQRPSIELAKKLQNTLSIVLIERLKVEAVEQQSSQEKGPLTIGDMLKL